MIDSDTNNTDNSNTIFECGLSSSAIIWAKEHGSDFLRFCVEEGIKCVRLYNQERVQKEAPDWKILNDTVYPPSDPPVDVMELLARARERFPNAYLQQISRVHHEEFVVVVESPWPDGYDLIFEDRIIVEDDDDLVYEDDD